LGLYWSQFRYDMHVHVCPAVCFVFWFRGYETWIIDPGLHFSWVNCKEWSISQFSSNIFFFYLRTVVAFCCCCVCFVIVVCVLLFWYLCKLFVRLFVAGRAIFQLSGGCHHYRCSALRTFEQGGIFIVSHLLRHGTSVYTVSSERPAPTSHSLQIVNDSQVLMNELQIQWAHQSW
jgi:hypothetical protein